ncbi:MAG: DUF1573 domain-containing protein [Fuerstiella sp.]
MKRFSVLMICCGFLLLGCSDESDPSAVPSVVAPDDYIKSKVATIKAIEKPTVVTEGPLPKAIAEKTEFSFGRMALGEKSKTTFEIRNDGEIDLLLEAGKPTCQCTSFSLSEETVAPGKTSILTVSWDAKRVDSTFQHGGSVYTNDPEHEELRFVVMGRIGAEYELQPAGNWNAGEAAKDRAATVSGVLFSTVNDEFEVERIESADDFITTEFRKLSVSELGELDGVDGFQVNVTVECEFEPGSLERKLQVFLKDRDEPIEVTVTAQRSGPIRILPTPGAVFTKEDTTLRMGGFSAAEGQDATLMLLVNNLDEPLTITDVSEAPSFLTIDLQPVGKDHRRYLLKVSVPPGVQKGIRDRKRPVQLRLETNHPEQKVLELDVTYRSS